MAQLGAIVDKLLSDVSIGLFQEIGSFISESLLTPVGVVQDSGLLGKYGNNHLRVHANVMGGRGMAPRVQLAVRDISTRYAIENHGLEGVVTRQDRKNVDLPFDAERDETMLITYAMLVAKEVGLAATLADPSVITANTTLTGTSQFDDFTNSDPIGVITTARQTVRSNCGMWPNAAWMESAVYEKLRVHPQIWDRLGFKYNQTGQLTQDNVAQALNVKRLLITEGVYNSAAEGQADVLSPIWGKHLWFGVIAQNPALMQKTLGYYVFDKARGKRTVYKYAINNPPEATAILVEDDYDQLISDAKCAYGIFNAIS